jgi:hypothetical protein
VEEVAERWLREVYRPTLARISAAVGPGRDLIQAYCDVLEEKWLLSEREGRDIGLAGAIEAYLALGAPAPESPATGDEVSDVLDPLDLDLVELDPLAEGEPADPDLDRDLDPDGEGEPASGMAPSDE